MQTREDSFNEHVTQIRNLISERKLEALVLRRNPNLAWLLGGRVHVPVTIDAACLDVVITSDRVYAVTNVIEAPRLIAEELPTGLEVTAVPWWEGRDPHLPMGENVGTDQPGGARIDLGMEIEILRSSLTEYDSKRYRTISSDAGSVLAEVMKDVQPTDREIDVAAKISAALWSKNLEIAFIGIAGKTRAPLFRHPLPTSDVVGARVVASICAKQKGLIASVTRIVSFEPWSDEYEAQYNGLLAVEAAMLDATSIGSPFSQPVLAASQSYGHHGFDAVEWHHHHQGGPTGFLPRDWPANLTSSRLIAPAQPISWNPTARGWKVEDTWLAQASGPQLLSLPTGWPTTVVAGRVRPEVLLR